MLVDEDWFFWSHRRSVARHAIERGWRVTLASRFGAHRALIEAMGVEVAPIALRGGLQGPLDDAVAFRQLVALYRKLSPDVVHHVSLKPIIVGSAAARVAGIGRVVNAVSGLGYVFSANARRARALRPVVRLSVGMALRSRGSVAVFQNQDDATLILGNRAVPSRDFELIPGCGANLVSFVHTPEPAYPPFTVLFAGRMLWSKGVGTVVEAVRSMRAGGSKVRLVLAGDVDPKNPESIDSTLLHEWTADGSAEWVGRSENIASLISGAHVVVLVSDREGIPKVLVEASASGRAIVASAVPGCRDVIRNEINGLLVPPRDPKALQAALNRLEKEPELRSRLGRAARRIAELEYDEDQLSNRTVDLYERLMR